MVHDELAVAAGFGETGVAKSTDMVRHEVLLAADDVREVMDTELARLAEGRGDQQAGWVPEQPRGSRGAILEFLRRSYGCQGAVVIWRRPMKPAPQVIDIERCGRVVGAWLGVIARSARSALRQW